MRLPNPLKWLLLLLATLAVFACVIAALYPWQKLAEDRIILALTQAGMQPVSLAVTGVNLHGIAMKGVSLGEPALTFDNLSIAYSARALLQHNEKVPVVLHSENLSRAMGDGSIVVGAIEATLNPGKTFQQWKGTWRATGIRYATDATPFPALHGSGDIGIDNGIIDAGGSFEDDKKSYSAAFTLHYDVHDMARSLLTIERLRLPWNDGVVATQNVTVPLTEKRTIRFTLKVQKVSLSTLLQVLTGDKATATGVVSGSVPVTLAAGNKIGIGKGGLQADAPGVITLSPEVIPGDNPQVGMVRELMKNLHYSQLGIRLEMAGDALKANLVVEGRNPEVQGGRPVKLNVNLSGDLLDLILQNATLMSDPKTFIENHRHDKN